MYPLKIKWMTNITSPIPTTIALSCFKLRITGRKANGFIVFQEYSLIFIALF